MASGKANLSEMASRLLSKVARNQAKREEEGEAEPQSQNGGSSGGGGTEEESEFLAVAHTLSSWKDSFAVGKLETKRPKSAVGMSSEHETAAGVVIKVEEGHSETASSPTPASSATRSESQSNPGSVSPTVIHDAEASARESSSMAHQDDTSTPFANPAAESKSSSARRKRKQAQRLVNYEQALMVTARPPAMLSIHTGGEPRIYQGAKFTSFAEFEEAFDTWKEVNHHPFRVASSETLKLPDGSVYQTFRYRYIVYHCSHYGTPRMRGNGKRPNQNYLPCGCQAKLRMNFNYPENVLRITSLNDEHFGHEMSADFYKSATGKVRKLKLSPTDSIGSNATSSTAHTSTSAMNSPVVYGAGPGGGECTRMEEEQTIESGVLEQTAIPVSTYTSLANGQSVVHSSPSSMGPASQSSALTSTASTLSSSVMYQHPSRPDVGDGSVEGSTPVRGHFSFNTPSSSGHGISESTAGRSIVKLLDFLNQQHQRQPKREMPDTATAGTSALVQHLMASPKQQNPPISLANSSSNHHLLLPLIQNMLNTQPQPSIGNSSSESGGLADASILAQLISYVGSQPSLSQSRLSQQQHTPFIQQPCEVADSKPSPFHHAPMMGKQFVPQALHPTSSNASAAADSPLYQQVRSNLGKAHTAAITSPSLLQAIALCSGDSERELLLGLFKEADFLIQFLREHMLYTKDIVGFIAQLRELVKKLLLGSEGGAV